MNRVLFVRHGYFPGDTRLFKQVKVLLENNFAVDIICLRFRNEKIFEKNENLSVVRIPFQHRRGTFGRYIFEYSISFLIFFSFISLKAFLKKYHFVVVHTLPDYLTYSTIFAKLFGSRIYTDFHEPTPELIKTKWNLSDRHILVRFSKIIEQKIIKYSELSITVTNALKNRFIERGAEPDKVFVITNVIDESAFQFSDNLVHNPVNNCFTLVCHGSIEERYGHETVIRAINELRKEFPDIKFLVPGEGSYLKPLLELTEKLDCEKNIKFLGHLPFEKLLEVLVNANAGIISMYRTPYSELIDTNKMYEYIQLKLPVIVSKLSPIIENFTSEEVVFFEPGDHMDLAVTIEKLILNPERKKNYIRNASLKYENIKWSVVKKSFVQMFQ